MELRKKVDRFYYDMAVSQMQLANMEYHHQVSYHSILYLDLIAYTKDCTVSKLSKLLHVAPSAATLKVKELQRLGLVEKIQSQEDKRVYYLYVNERLKKEYEAYDRVLYGALDEIEATFSQQEVQTLCKMLDTINRHFKQELPQAASLEKGLPK